MVDTKVESLSMRGATALVATQNNYLLLKNEIGIETDTYKMKLGDGKTRWNLLPYLPFTTVTKTLIDAWNAAITSPETDPVFASSPASGITNIMIANWNTALTVEVDPLFTASAAAGITPADIVNWNSMGGGGLPEDDVIAYAAAL